MIYPDVSHYNTVTGWTAVRKNCSFIISKATQGTGYVDPSLSGFINGCEANKIPYWLYAYLNKGNEAAQVRFLIDTCREKIGKYFCGYILDVEANNTAANVKAALHYITDLGIKAMLYTMYADYSKYASVIHARPSSCAWWEARYGKNNGVYDSAYPCHSGADLHQYTDQGICPGISGKTDLNRLTGTKPETWFTTSRLTAGDTTTPKEENQVIYQTIQEIPEWYRPTIEKLVADGSIAGVGDNKLNLSEDICRVLTILDQHGVLKP